MLTWIKEKILLIFLVMSLIGNGGLVMLLMNGGIHISNSSTSTSTSNAYSNASSASIGININGGNYWGDKKVAYQFKQFASLEEALVFINTLDEGSLYNKEIISTGLSTVAVVYRTTLTDQMKQTGSVTKTVVNGVEVVEKK